MKSLKDLFAVFLVAGAVLASDGVKANLIAAHFDSAVCHNGQCQAIAKSTGKQCKHCVSKPGDLYCWEHMK